MSRQVLSKVGAVDPAKGKSDFFQAIPSRQMREGFRQRPNSFDCLMFVASRSVVR